MIYFLEILYAIICIGLAYWNYKIIEADKKIFHGLNGAIHFFLWMLSTYLSTWQILIAMPFIGRLVFDWALNSFRGLHPSYVPVDPKSIIDKIEKKVFGNDGYAVKEMYLFIIVLVNAYFIVKHL